MRGIITHSRVPPRPWRYILGYRGRLVEAAGIEPASEDASAGITTCVAYLLDLAQQGSGRRDPSCASPIDLTQIAGAGNLSQPALATPLSNHAGEVRQNVTA